MTDYIVTLNNRKNNVSITENSTVIVNDKKYHYELLPLNGNTYLLKLENKFFEISADKINKEKYVLLIKGQIFETIIRTTLQEKASSLIEQGTAGNHKADVKAPMPGMILKLKHQEGDKVDQGESILILEAMKMENDLRSPSTGILEKIHVKEGMPVEKGALLFTVT